MPAVPSCLLEPLWDQFAALLPMQQGFSASHPLGCHRRRVPDRVVFEHVVLALVHGSGYERIASTGCSDRTIRRRVKQWAELGIAQSVHALALEAYDRMIGLGPTEISVDGCITKAPSSGEKAGRSPVDRGKQGLKRSVASDACGVPLGMVSDGANRHDSPLLGPTLEAVGTQVGAMPDTVNVNLDRGYDSAKSRSLMAQLGFTAEIARKGIPAPIQAGKRWVVERMTEEGRRVPPTARITKFPKTAADQARWWEGHILEVLHGLPPDAPQAAVPRPEFDPRLRSLAERERAKAAELTAAGHRMTASGVKQRRQRYRRDGLVDRRSAKQLPPFGQIAPVVVDAMRQAIAETTDASSRTVRFIIWRTRLLALDERLEHAAARPVFVPETVVCDHGKLLISNNFRASCRFLGITLQPTHKASPFEKGVTEKSLGSVATLFTQFVAGYTGRSVDRRGRHLEDGPLWSLPELQELLDEWIVAVWQNRPHDFLRDPDAPKRAFSPNEKYAMLLESSGYVPAPLSGEDYVELLPERWRRSTPTASR